MKAFYSIVSINTKPEINERLSIGMLLSTKNTLYFHYSKTKLSVIQKLIDKSTYKATLEYLKLIEKSFTANANINYSNSSLDLKVENKYTKIFSEQYILYLSKYSNNLVSFSKPKILDIEVSEDIFKQLFSKLIDNYTSEHIYKQEGQVDRFKKEFFSKAEQYFNIEQEIDSSIYSGLFTPVKLDLMGKNEIEVFGQTIDFDKPLRTLEFNIGTLLQINKAIPKSKQFVLGFEPDKILEVNHKIWNNVRKYQGFEYVDISESGKIMEYAIDHGVKPLFN